MSEIRVDALKNEGGTGAPQLTYGAEVLVGQGITGAGGVNVSGVVTAASFSGSAAGLTGSGAALSGIITAGDANTSQTLTGNLTISNNLTITNDSTIEGNLTVRGTQTIINTTELDVEDKTIGIGSTSTPSNVTANNAGVTIYASTDNSDDKKLYWSKDPGTFEYNQGNKFKGVIETVAAATTYYAADGGLVVELDAAAGTAYTYFVHGALNVGIVSIKNMPAVSGTEAGTTLTLITTQNSTAPTGGVGNTLPKNGIGTNFTVVGFSSGSVAGISTRGFVGGGSTYIGLSTIASQVDFTSIFVHYNGGTNTTASSYKVYVTQNGGYQQMTVGI